MWFLFQGLILRGPRLEYPLAMDAQYLASGIGAGLALVATHIVVAWQDRRGRYKK